MWLDLVTHVLLVLMHFMVHDRYQGSLIHFYKRAQILVADLWAAFGCQTSSDNGHFASFVDISRLTMFADYRVPQILRHLDVRIIFGHGGCGGNYRMNA